MKLSPAMTQHRIITCFIRAGLGQLVLERLLKEKDIDCAYAWHARGTGLAIRRDMKRPEYVEREMITVMVQEAQADEIFRFLYSVSGVDQPHGGMILMTASPRAVSLNQIEDGSNPVSTAGVS